MSTEKDNEFLQFILDSTQAGKVQWAPTALNTEFTAGFKGKYKVNIEKRLDRDGDIKYMMTLTNAEDGRDLLALDAYRGKLQELYEMAQRIALNVDNAIDDIMGG